MGLYAETVYGWCTTDHLLSAYISARTCPQASTAYLYKTVVYGINTREAAVFQNGNFRDF